MAQVTLEQLQKTITKGFRDQSAKFDKKLDFALTEQDKRFDKKLEALKEELKKFVQEQDEELARMVNKGFKDVWSFIRNPLQAPSV